MKKSLRMKAFALLLLIAFILSVTSVFCSSVVHNMTVDRLYTELATKMARGEALYVDEDKFAAYAERTRAIFDRYCEEHGGAPVMDEMTEEEKEAYIALFDEVYTMEDYELQREYLMKLGQGYDVRYIYINLWDLDRGCVIYLMDGSEKDERTPVGWVEPIEEENLKMIRAGQTELPAYITNYPEYGWLCTAVANINDADGNAIAHAYIDISINAVKKEYRKFIFNIGLMLVVYTTILMTLGLYFFDRIIVNPIKRISDAATRFVSSRGSQEKDVFSSLNIRSEDEVGQLSVSLHKMENEITQYINDITVITAEKERVGAELHIARHIQADMLPSIFPAFPGKREFDIFATMDPAKEVGGDFYDFFFVDENHLCMVMADVSGKGVPAALFMVITKTLIKNRAMAGGSPSEILSDVNEQLCEGNKAQLFVTVWIAILNTQTGDGVAANAGHENPVIRRVGGDYELVKYRHSPAVAAMDGIPFRQHDFHMDPGDTLFVYTDGVPEATNANSELYGTDRMLEVLNRHKGVPLTDLLGALKDDIALFVGDAPQFDDITMLALHYTGREE